MVRDITTTVYTFDELSADAQSKAVEEVRQKLGGAWWDSSDSDDIEGVIVVTLGEQLGEPKAADYGPGDYPGIPHIKVTEWSLGRGQTLAMQGYLNRENAPRLPWTDGMVQVDLVSMHDDHSYITVETTDLDEDDYLPATKQEIETIIQAVRDAMSAAMFAGEAEMEYKTSEEHAREWCENNAREYTEDGSMYY